MPQTHPTRHTPPGGITPLPVPPGTPLVILFGGTFDPPHPAHVALPVLVRGRLERALGCKGRAWLVYVPAARSPHKSSGPCAPARDRVEMLRLALDGVPRAAVWTDETDRAEREDASYAVDTVHRARAWLDAHAGAATVLRLLIGADQASSFHRWREPRDIIAVAEPAVMLRAPATTPGQLISAMRATGAWNDGEIRQWEERIMDVGTREDAATAVRAALAAADAHPPALDARVRQYIAAHDLYRGPGPDAPRPRGD